MTDNPTSLAAALASTSPLQTRRYKNESNLKVDLSRLIELSGIRTELSTFDWDPDDRSRCARRADTNDSEDSPLPVHLRKIAAARQGVDLREAQSHPTPWSASGPQDSHVTRRRRRSHDRDPHQCR